MTPLPFFYTNSLKQVASVFFVFFSLSTFQASAQCGTDGVTVALKTQIDINNFQSTLGATCTDYLGKIEVFDDNDGVDNIVDLSPLAFLTSVGVLEIFSNQSLTSLTGLENITYAGELGVDNNSMLLSLSGLAGLTEVVNGNLSIDNNDKLTNLVGLESLEYVDFRLMIHNNDMLTNLNGLESLTTVEFGLSIQSNPALTDLMGLRFLTTVKFSLSVQNNALLPNLKGLEGLTSVSNSLFIRFNPTLGSGGVSDYCALYPLLSGGGFTGTYTVNSNNATAPNPTQQEIVDNGACPCGTGEIANLTSQAEVDGFMATLPAGCTDFEGDINIGSLDIGTDIAHLTPLNFLTNVGGFLGIFNNPMLTDLSGLENIDSVGVLSVQANSSLLHFEGLDNLEYIGGLQILVNSMLNDFSGLENLAYVGGNINVSFNPALTNFNCLQNLTTANALIVDNNSSLINFNGLQNLTTANALIVDNNSSLINFEGLDGLENVTETLVINNNSNLENLSGLEGLSTVGGDVLLIRFNDELGSGGISDYCALHTSLEGGSISGTYLVTNNNAIAPNPTQQEIVDNGACPCSVNTATYTHNGTCYLTLAEAITATGGSGIVEINNNAELTETITIPAGINIAVQPDATWTNSSTLTNSGTITLVGTAQYINSTTGTYTGSGNFNGNFVNNGTIQIGG